MASLANNTDFARSDVGLDPIIGQKSDGKIVGQEAMTLDSQNNVITDAVGNIQTHPIKHQWPTQYDDPASPKVACDFGAFVTLEGGEFFFTPSIPYLLQFGTQEAAVSSDIKENERRGVPLLQASS